MKDYVIEEKENVMYGIFSAFQRHGIEHGISLRNGGFSEAPFRSLNLALHVGDIEERVLQNREKFFRTFGCDFSQMVTAEQVHDANIAVVGTKEIGRGSLRYTDAIPQTDGLVTNQKGIPLTLLFADCVPVLVADPVEGVIGICHAGWRGTAKRIVQQLIGVMERQFGAHPGHMIAGIAPSIGPCCYEVGQHVAEIWERQFLWDNIIEPQEDGQWRLDLWETNYQQLREMGVADKNITVSRVCTQCANELYYSYRGEKGLTGRMAAMICL